ncbi:MAG: glycosyltransferase [Patescibacteria group bacterium]|nr:glycosyltransferase [Patescibacteria group bacterium]
MDVSIIITCWNGKKLLEKNLPAVIKAAKNPRNRIKEILVVDDASLDDSVKFLEENFPETKVIRQPKNFGYAVTCNTGVKMAKNELVAILNLDVVPSINFLESVFPLLANKKVFAVSFNEGQFGPGNLVWENGFFAD